MRLVQRNLYSEIEHSQSTGDSLGGAEHSRLNSEMLNCKQIPEKADEYIDDELSIGQRLSASLHLLMCVHCRRYVRQMTSTVATLRKMPYTEACSDEEVEQTLDRLLRQEKSDH